jgi:hypothetical protein
LIKKYIFAVLVCAFFIFSSSGFGFLQRVQDFEESNLEDDQGGFLSQDGRFLTQLEWVSFDNSLPGSYQNYIENNPLSAAIFSTPLKKYAPIYTQQNTVSILVDTQLYPLISSSLNQYIADLESEGNVVLLQTVQGGNPDQIKDWVKSRYDQGSTAMVFIGNIAAAWVEVSGEVFPCDLFYMDLDGVWLDTNNDGIYDSHSDGSGDMGPEVYVGRIHAYSLSYESEAVMVNDYLSKVHAYRRGDLSQSWSGLEYIDEDWYSMDVSLNSVYGENITRYDLGYFTTASDYVNELSLGQHFVQVCAHSYSGGHHFGTCPTESAAYAHTYIYSPSNRSAKLLLGSDDGIKVWINGINVYTNNRWGGWTVDEFEVDIVLQQGWNRLLLKISQEGGTYLFSARLTDENYENFDDVLYHVNNPVNQSIEGEFIRSWLLHGFHQDSSENFWQYLTTNYLDVDEPYIDPVEGEEMAGKIWTKFASGSPYIDLSLFDQKNYGVIYGYVKVYSDSEQDCELWMGYDDGARVWLNAEQIIYDNRYGGFEADMTRVSVTLQQGVNLLLVKISQWMGDHGFSARFCNPDGSEVAGLSYDPVFDPISHVGMWLINGPYANKDKNTRLSYDYLQGESAVMPSEGDPAPFNDWQFAIGSATPFNVGGFFDSGDWILSSDIQQLDPPVLFYNLFACGPGRFTDENYLAGSYIFNTTYGLIAMASSKSGSMLNFYDFYQPLGSGESIGDSFRLWFDAQAPYVQWEKEWFYGMVLIGDPTLSVVPSEKTQVQFTRPLPAVYIRNEKILPFFVPVVFGDIVCGVTAFNQMYDIVSVDFFIDGECKASVVNPPYEYVWDTFSFFRHTLHVEVVDSSEVMTKKQMNVWKFF